MFVQRTCCTSNISPSRLRRLMVVSIRLLVCSMAIVQIQSAALYMDVNA
jgi:hypothetical protein